MAVYEIPLSNDKPSFTFKVDLGGSEYKFNFRWNGRVELWYVDLYDANGDAVALGEPFYSDTLMYRNNVRENKPEGSLYAINEFNAGVNADRFSIGVDVKFYYQDAT